MFRSISKARHALAACQRGANVAVRVAPRPVHSSFCRHHSVRFLGTLVDFKLADIGEGIAEVEIMQWKVKVGDRVAQFDQVAEVQSDKATVELSSRYDGIVRELCYPVGAMAKVGEPIMKIETEDGPVTVAAGGGGAAAPAAAAAPPAAPAQQSPAAATEARDASNGKVLTTPSVRRMAREHGLDLTKFDATGPKGRLLKEDVLRGMASGPSPAAAARAPAATPAAAATAAAATTTTTTPTGAATSPLPPRATPRSGAAPADQVVKVSGIQRVMVQSMTEASKVPTLLYCDDVLMDELVSLRKELKPAAEKRGVRLSYLPFIIKATSLALREFPRMNSLVNADCSEVTLKGPHNIGIAMDTPRGLVVPSIKNVQDLSVMEIARELVNLQALGASGKLGIDDLKGGTFTLSNVGAVGGTYAYPLLVCPQVCIGAMGKFQTLPRFDSKMQVVPATVMQVSWAADHRVIEGAYVANFSNAWKYYLENPHSMILDTR